MTGLFVTIWLEEIRRAKLANEKFEETRKQTKAYKNGLALEKIY